MLSRKAASTIPQMIHSGERALMAIALFMSLLSFGCNGAPEPSRIKPSTPPAPVSAKPRPHPRRHQEGTITGQDAFGDWTTQDPGVRRKIVVADLPQPYATV